MKTRIWLVIPAILLVAFVILFSIIRWTRSPNTHSNGFSRSWIADTLHLSHLVSTGDAHWRIGGNTATHLFFYGRYPYNLMITDTSLTHTDTMLLPFPLKREELGNYDLFVDSPMITLLSRKTNASFRFTLGDSVLLQTTFSSPLFTRVAIISPHTVAMRAFDITRSHQLLLTTDIKSGKILQQADPFPQQIDAGFSTDGLLQYDSATKSIVYMQFYQNKFFCYDTALQLRYIANTIDTNNTNHIITRNTVVVDKKQQGSVMPAVPLNAVNSNCSIYNGNLFVMAAFKSDNEQLQQFEENIVIDTYRLTDGQYIGSFYVPRIVHKKPSRFAIVNNTLLVFYQGTITAFLLPAILFNKQASS